MRYVIIRDDDTNAFTPVECLERLYRPFLDRGLPVSLATIPDVATSATMADGRPEGFLLKKNGERARSRPLGSNQALVGYLQSNPGYHIVQHGLHHHWLEFDRPSAVEVAERLDRGTKLLLEAGFAQPKTFVAPYDKLSRAALQEVAVRFRVLSTGWFELGRLPWTWWPGYMLKKARRTPHWRIGQTLLLSHPGCLLSYQHPSETMLDIIKRHISSQRLTVLVTHWWEYFRQGRPDEPFIHALHETAEYLATNPELKVISFDDLLTQSIPLN
jgi:Uncharacterized protein conserved in bacteria (DUF2334)